MKTWSLRLRMSQMDTIWSYLSTDGIAPGPTRDVFLPRTTTSTSVILARHRRWRVSRIRLAVGPEFCRCFGGELELLLSMEGYGTDAFVRFLRDDDSSEPVPL
jgi:hypothetical protein